MRGGGGRHDCVTGRWVMEALVIVALVCVSYEEGIRAYGFATHVWETGGRDCARVEMVNRWGGRGWEVGASVGVGVGDVGRSKGAGRTSRGWYEMVRKSMGPGSVWC